MRIILNCLLPTSLPPPPLISRYADNHFFVIAPHSRSFTECNQGLRIRTMSETLLLWFICQQTAVLSDEQISICNFIVGEKFSELSKAE